MLCYISPEMIEALLKWISTWPRLIVVGRVGNTLRSRRDRSLPFNSLGGRLRALYARLYRWL
jgi:hypothetical protein